MPGDDFYSQWCKRFTCDHGHCPFACEHPQPFGAVLKGETEPKLLCGRCWHVDGIVTEMVPCNAENC